MSVAFTTDFDGLGAETLVRRYRLALLYVDAPRSAKKRIKDLAILDINTDGIETVVEPTYGPSSNDDLDFDRPWIVFSSGSAGGIKSMIPSRRGVEASVSAAAEALQCSGNDALLLFLPMSGFQQRMLCYATLWIGGELILSNPANVFAALRVMSPTFLIAPPIFYDLISTRINALPRHKLMLLSLADAFARMLPPQANRRLRRHIYRSVHQALGGKMRIMLTGMAPAREAMLREFERLGLPLFEAYGLGEAGPVAFNVPGNSRIGSVGRVVSGVTLRIAEDGEILVRRTVPVAVDYLEAADGEAETVFKGNNWIATGDIGRVDEDGFLYILGRKKLVMVNSSGEKLHPEVLEKHIENCPEVRNAVAFQRGGGVGIGIIVSVERDTLDVRHAVELAIMQHNKAHPGFLVSQQFVTADRFTVNNGLLRPNMKIDRIAAIQKYAGTADAMTTTAEQVMSHVAPDVSVATLPARATELLAVTSLDAEARESIRSRASYVEEPRGRDGNA
jgi:long-subunit acyl-CoA synthetase (AMP-forming)